MDVVWNEECLNIVMTTFTYILCVSSTLELLAFCGKLAAKLININFYSKIMNDLPMVMHLPQILIIMNELSKMMHLPQVLIYSSLTVSDNVKSWECSCCGSVHVQYFATEVSYQVFVHRQVPWSDHSS